MRSGPLGVPPGHLSSYRSSINTHNLYNQRATDNNIDMYEDGFNGQTNNRPFQGNISSIQQSENDGEA